MSALCQSAVPAVGSRQRFTALPLHRLPAHVQRIDRHTPLAHLRKKERWEAQIEALIIGESVTKAAKRCGVAGVARRSAGATGFWRLRRSTNRHG